MILISHSLPDAFPVSDRIAALRIGEVVATYRTAAVSADDVVGAVTGARAPALDGWSGR